MNRLTQWLARGLALLWLTAPVTTLADPAPDLTAFDAAWTAYADEANGRALQFGCRPRRYPPPADIPRRGAVVAFHGFSACTQQFFQLGPELAARGYDVLVPMLPGHGLVPGPDGEDDLSEVPTAENWAVAYGGLAERMNRIMALSPGERIVVGYSLGGALAVNAAHRNPELYARMLLIAPLFSINGGPLLEGLADWLGRVPGVRDIVVKPRGYQQLCDGWAAAGRAGFCDYRLEHVPAMIQLERQNRAWSTKKPLRLPIQVITADGDVVVSNAAIDKQVEQQRQFGTVAVCQLTGDVPHEILTPYENVGREMFWLPGFIQMAGEFVVHGAESSCQ